MKINTILEALSDCSEQERKLAEKHLQNLALREEDRKKESARRMREFKERFKRKYK